MSSGRTQVTGSNNRVYYTRPSPDTTGDGMFDSFTYIVNNIGFGNTTYDSYEGTVTIVPTTGAIVGSSFLLNNDGWTITGNKESTGVATFESYSRGLLLNHYIFGMDNKINIASSSSIDASLWYFEAPAKYLGNKGIAYGGSIQFTLGSFSGDFSKLNGNDMHLIELECSTCTGPVGKGITLAFPISSLKLNAFSGEPMRFTVPLHESEGWIKDPQNVLKSWTTPSKCDLIQVLSRLSAFRILGDWTTWYESIALDDVSFINTKSQLPICSMVRPDASVCTC